MAGERTDLRVSEAVYLEELSRTPQKKIDVSVEKRKSLKVRYYYGIIFLTTNFVAWLVRDYIQRVIPENHFLRTCGVGGHDCIQTIGVLRISFGCFIFFFLMFLTTLNTNKLQEVRNAWHSGEFARIGAGVFLALQLISVIQFIAWWNNYWMPDVKRKQSCSLGLFMSTVFYVASICGVVALYILYVPRSSCTLNIFFITWTAVLLIVMMLITLHSKVNRGLLSSGIMAAYVVFLCWSAIRSEPAGDKCSPQKQVTGHHDWITVFSFFIGICAIVMATFSTGIDSESFQFRKDEVEEEDDIPYKYGFFHLVFSLGAMYFAMLFINWDLNSSTRTWSIDVGWASTWVKIINEWFAATIYMWKLISPVVRQAKIVDEGAIQPDQSC
ncbi:uncharacterized protein [Spinacia oleracea]|uniref:Uncharacterized protein isoform X2 n=1 Tax=Spinacia oleracea TaxID=3562 RepID=A0A9R0K5B9_SPIOL|nr:uncharacterized protein LOC110798254 isoform X2 [Spinacia oleracea]